MAVTSYTTSSAETAKVWAKKTLMQGIQSSVFGLLYGKDADSFVYIKDDLKKTKGDRVTVTLMNALTGDGVQGSGVLEGNEESVNTYTQNLLIDELRNAVRVEMGISYQRNNAWFDVRKQSQDLLSDWFADRMSQSLLNQLTGNTVPTDTKRTGNNPVTATDSGHTKWKTAHVTAQTLDATDVFTLRNIDLAVNAAKTYAGSTGAPIRRGKIMGELAYAVIIHPNQWDDCKSQTGVADWTEITKAAYQGNKGDDPIANGALKRSMTEVVGKYNGTYILVDPRVPAAIHSTAGTAVANTRMAVFIGAQAACMAFGSDNDAERMKWVEDTFDYEHYIGVAAGSIFGIIRSYFNSLNFASVVLPTYTTIA